MGVTWLIGAITDAVFLMIFNEVTGEKYYANDGKESDEQSRVNILEYTFGGGVKYMEVWWFFLILVCCSLFVVDLVGILGSCKWYLTGENR